jgi:hypothetical protein
VSTFGNALAAWPIAVTDHAMWRAAERFRRDFDTAQIEPEVRAALTAGRVSVDRSHLGLTRHGSRKSLFVWTEDGSRVYALRHDPECFVVTTTMRPAEAGASIREPSKLDEGRPT